MDTTQPNAKIQSTAQGAKTANHWVDDMKGSAEVEVNWLGAEWAHKASERAKDASHREATGRPRMGSME